MKNAAAVTAGTLLLGLGTAAHAQDRRTVTEPQLPARACLTLKPGPGDRAAALRAALDTCKGQALRLSPGRYDSGPLTIPAGTTLWLDKGAVLAAIPDPKLYDAGEGVCGTITLKNSHGCRAFLTIPDATNVAIVGDGTIDGNGGQPMAGGTETWWQLARRAQKEGGNQNVPRLVVVSRGRNLVLYRTHFVNSPNFHIVVSKVQGFTAWGVTVSAPADARNTDGIDPGGSDDITITRSWISTGDDDIAIKGGGAGPVRYMSVTDSHFYAGHGMSIGSETNNGVSYLLVRNLTLDGTSSGLRIKSDVSRGGLVEHVRYEDICLRGNARPIELFTAYDNKATGSLIPVYRDIVFKNVVGGTGRLIANGYDAAHVLELVLDGVRFAAGAKWETVNAHFTVGAGGASPLPDGVSGPAATVADACAGKFVPLPG